MTKVSLIILCFFVAHTIPCAAQDLTLFKKHTYYTSSDTLPYRLLHPETIDPEKKYPLVLFLHGSGERGNDNELNLKYITDLFLNDQNRDTHPAFVLVPQCPSSESWKPKDWLAKPNEPVITVINLIDSLVNMLSIDVNRIYVIGLSMGGYGTWYLITRFPDKFAAAVPICGGGDWNQAKTIQHIPLWVFHGRKDDVVLPEQSRKMVHALKKAGGKPLYTEYKKVGHDSWTPAFKEPELLPWMFSHQLISKY